MSATILKSLMLRATHLTRSGLLREATAAIQTALGGKTAGAANAPGASKGRVFDMEKNALGRPNAEPEHSPCAPPPPSQERPLGGHFLSGSYSSHALSRKYKLFLPRGDTAGMPLIVMLHGCTQDPDDFAAGTRMNELAEEMGFLVLYPAQGRDANPNRCWNWFDPGHQSRGAGEPALIADLALHLVKEYQLDSDRIYIAGMSAGGAMATILADEYPEIFAAAGVHSGLPRGAARNMMGALSVMRSGNPDAAAIATGSAQPIPMIVFHGDADGTVNPKNGLAIVTLRLQAARSKQFDGRAPIVDQISSPGGETSKILRYVDNTGARFIEYWQVHGSGHAWAGGSDEGSFTDPNGPDASRSMLEFLLAHRKH